VQDGDAQSAVGVDVGVVEGVLEPEICGTKSVPLACRSSGINLTWRAVRIVVGEGHFGHKVSTMVHRVGICDDEGDFPDEDVVVDELGLCKQMQPAESGMANLNVCPGLF
jgi:hypothetical protein